MIFVHSWRAGCKTTGAVLVKVPVGGRHETREMDTILVALDGLEGGSGVGVVVGSVVLRFEGLGGDEKFLRRWCSGRGGENIIGACISSAVGAEERRTRVMFPAVIEARKIVPAGRGARKTIPVVRRMCMFLPGVRFQVP